MRTPSARAALLAKCDLTTDMVKEFTELQGVVGGLYAQGARRSRSGRDGHLRSLQAGEHGRFDSAHARRPDRRACRQAGYAARLLPRRPDSRPARKIRSRCGARRRASSRFWSKASCRSRSARLRRAMPELREFLQDRISYYFRDVRGFAYDEVNAVMARRLRTTWPICGSRWKRFTTCGPRRISSRSPPASSASRIF